MVSGATLCLLLVCAFASRATAQALVPELGKPDDAKMTITQRGRVRAPELTGGRGWLNTDRPLTLANLRGKFVLLDFWTYGCINCIHIIPELKRLEAKYPNNLVVIGVHSAKFENEKETDNIRRIILRYEIEHPVVNDADFNIWGQYAVNAWPTQVLIAPDGYVVGKVVGEGNYEKLDETLAALIPEYRERGSLDESPLKLALEKASQAPMPLQFPGKVLADGRGKRLFIADSNHNRIIVTDLDGKLLDTIGTGAQGRRDGALTEATFYRPQGMALSADGSMLYVADTQNHLLRAVDLKTRQVKTVAGTGEQLRERFIEGATLQTKLSSPWDVLIDGSNLYIAMAGPHQIWRMDLTTNTLALFAGSAQWREARADGKRLDSAFAQPSGLTSDGKTLYVADSESNIIRGVDLAPADGEVRTLAGGDLFEFGDTDGEGDDVRLQHPLGVAFAGGAVFISDTYNHKIKRLDPATRTVTTFAGTGKPGQTDGASSANGASFYEPGGLSYANGKLYVADTNNHAVRVVDLRTKQVSTLAIKGLRPPQTAIAANDVDASAVTGGDEIVAAPQVLQANGAGALVINVQLPAGYHLNELAPHRVDARITRGAESLAFAASQPTFKRTAKDLRLPVSVPLEVKANGVAEVRVAATLYYCREDNTGACRIKTLRWHVPVEVKGQADAAREVRLAGEIKF